MIGKMENVNIVSSFHKKSKPYGKIENRRTHGFLYKISGCSDYFVGGESFRLNSGELVFMPMGVSYEYMTDCGEYTSINFEADMEKPEISVYSLKDFQGAKNMLLGFSEAWKFGCVSDRYKCISDFYELLSYLAHLDTLGNREDGNYRIIEPATEYIKKHIYEVDFKVDKLHNLCGISDTYFRKIFIKRYGVTPKEYVQRERITHARLIIDSGDFDTIGEVADAVGYADPLYFSKVFRKYYGFPPSSI